MKKLVALFMGVMKSIKFGFIIFLCIVVSLLSGCTKQVHSIGKRDINEAFPLYSAMLFEQKEAVLTKLNLQEKELEEYPVNGIILPEQETVANYPYDVTLLFVKDTDEFYGFHYKTNLTDKEQALKQYDSAISWFRTKWGEPSTYPGLGNRYLDAKDPMEKLQKNGSGSLVETWELPVAEGVVIPENLHYELRAQILYEKQDNSYMIWFSFSIANNPN